MEVKWDIYIYDSTFLLARSWTGQLNYRAKAEVTADAIRIRSIETMAHLAEIAPQAVYFLIGSHAMGQVLPHPIPRDTPEDPHHIALVSFSMFGNKACYASYEDTTRYAIKRASAS
jgi:hypothetical protein